MWHECRESTDHKRPKQNASHWDSHISLPDYQIWFHRRCIHETLSSSQSLDQCLPCSEHAHRFATDEHNTPCLNKEATATAIALAKAVIMSEKKKGFHSNSRHWISENPVYHLNVLSACMRKKQWAVPNHALHYPTSNKYALTHFGQADSNNGMSTQLLPIYRVFVGCWVLHQRAGIDSVDLLLPHWRPWSSSAPTILPAQRHIDALEDFHVLDWPQQTCLLWQRDYNIVHRHFKANFHIFEIFAR